MLSSLWQFDSSTTACSWFLDHMASDTNWPVTIFLKCQVATIRQMFHRLCIHVIQKLRYNIRSVEDFRGK
jgi:ubiquitin carboxyl-terminal hydrolase 34